MFKRIAIATLAAGLLAGTAHAGTRDLSVITPKTKAQFSVAIDYYKNHCGGVTPALSAMYDQLQSEGGMDQAELSKLQTSAALVVALGDKTDLCQKLKPDVDNMAKFAEAMPVKDDPSFLTPTPTPTPTLASASDDDDNDPPTPAVSTKSLDYTDKSQYFCDMDTIQSQVASMVNDNLWGVKLLFVKGQPVEVSRKKTELRCRIEIATNKGNRKGVFQYFSEDGHAMVGWQPGKTR